MRSFAISPEPLIPEGLRGELADPACGGYCSFEGWVRDHNDGRRVERLEYEAFEALAIREGERIVAEAIERFGVSRAACVHRVGTLGVGDLAVWVGASSVHRGEAFAACRYIIDEVKHRLPIWKKEHYVDGNSGWVNCEHCAAAGASRQDYSRQVALPEVGTAGQARLAAASVLVVGAGGLGVPVLQYLAAAGVGRLGIVDGDRVEASNLHRQPLYGNADLGRPKVEAAAERLVALNRDVHVDAIATDATPDNIDELVAQYDIVVECTDNFRAKFLVNDAVVRAGRPAVFASVHQYEGQLQLYRPEPHWPCLRCLWPEAPRDGLVGNCVQAGVLGPVPATLGALQAMQVLKLLLGLDAADQPGLVTMDLLSFATRRIAAARNPHCDHGRRAAAPPSQKPKLELEFDSLEQARQSGLELVDVREAWERQLDPPGLRIDLHLPMSELVSGRAAFPAAGRYLVVCAHGVRSLALAEHLRSQGQADVYSLRGGIAAFGP